MKRLVHIIAALLVCLTLFPRTPVRVACVGNSVTFGAGIEEPEERYPMQLQELLGEDYQVENFGHSGACLLRNGHNPYVNLPEFEHALAFHPHVVVIHLGLNDTDPRNWPKHRDEFVKDYSWLINAFIDVNPEADVKICRMTPIFTGHRRFTSSTRDWFWQVQEAIETVAEVNGVELIDLHTPLYRNPHLFPDALHPTGEGAKIIAKTVYAAITDGNETLKLAPIFGDRMVLQRHQPIRLWGTAGKGKKIHASLNGREAATQVNGTGRWEILLPPMKAGGPYTLTLQSESQRVVLTDILVGDLWLCSGQSNMEFQMRHAETANEDIPNANHPRIRLYNMKPIMYTHDEVWKNEVLEKVNRLAYFQETEWQPCTPEQVADFSAIAYYFGEKVHRETKVPVGLILNAVGGSPAEAWIDRLTLEHHPRLVSMFPDWYNNDFIHPWCRERAAKNVGHTGENVQRHPYHPAYLYEAGIDRLTDLPITGVIWYQGESNEQNVELYEKIFPILVESWRKAWSHVFPFYYVQLSSMAVERETWGHFRDSQRRLLSVVPNSGMAVSSDLGDSTDVHPRKKKQVGRRLARLALHYTYNQQELLPSGPLFREATFKEGKAVVTFDYAEGLATSDQSAPRSFELAEYPGLFYPAIAEIKGDRVIISSLEVKNPRFVRYGWSPYSDGNLINREELPASTFTTEREDKFPTSTLSPIQRKTD